MLVLSFLLIPYLFKASKAVGFTVFKDNKAIFTYDLENDEIILSNDDSTIVTKSETSDKITIKLSFSNGAFNEIVIDKVNAYIFVSNSSCLNSTCVHSGKLKDVGAILCIPNGLKIVPIDNNSLILGGGA